MSAVLTVPGPAHRPSAAALLRRHSDPRSTPMHATTPCRYSRNAQGCDSVSRPDTGRISNITDAALSTVLQLPGRWHDDRCYTLELERSGVLRRVGG